MRTRPVCIINFPKFLLLLPSFPPSSLSFSVSPPAPPHTFIHWLSVYTWTYRVSFSLSPPNPSPCFNPPHSGSSQSFTFALVFSSPAKLQCTPLESCPTPLETATPTLSPQCVHTEKLNTHDDDEEEHHLSPGYCVAFCSSQPPLIMTQNRG